MPCGTWIESVTSAWKEKYLDYEIETAIFQWTALNKTGIYLKRKVSRLRDWNKKRYEDTGRAIQAWKEKYLDYEIETTNDWDSRSKRSNAWKEKYLDYEIETI